jgi:fatty acid kinase fatty acid binding subunit
MVERPGMDAAATPTTAIVADTTSYLPPELIVAHGVHLVSLYVGLEGDQEREADITDLHEFYERLRVSDQTVTTSQPSVGDFIAVYEPLLAEGREILSIHLSSGISGTYESAMQARERLTVDGKGGERIVICDSLTGCGGMGLMVLAASIAAESGASAAEANERAGAVRNELKIWFAVDTLDYLRRGGRIGAARAWIGTTLKIKPILTLDNEITPIERVRTRARAFERMVDYARQRHEDGADAWVVQHVQDEENAQRLVEACRPIFGLDPVFTSEIGPVIGAHVGPGLLGVGGVSRATLDSAH